MLQESVSERVGRAFSQPVDAASLAIFRIAFGALMCWEVVRYFQHDWIARYFIDPPFHFTYYGFGWVKPWPGAGMYFHFAGLGLLSLMIMLGVCYRISTSLFFIGFTYVFLLEQARYLNHFYFICLVSFLLIFIPAHRVFSLDAWLRAPKQRSAPAWAVWLLRWQIGIVYFYAGIAKLNGDWLRGEPLRSWLARRDDFPLLGEYFGDERFVMLATYGALYFDLLIVMFLLLRRTRTAAFAVAVSFHAMNASLFRIGVFPWLMIAVTTIFFSPSWPRSLLRRLRLNQDVELSTPSHDRRPASQAVVACCCIYIALQLIIPLRHFMYPGQVNWTEEGHRFAWHMKLRSKRGDVRFLVVNKNTKQAWEVEPRAYLTSWQARKMSTRPDMILQFSHYLAQHLPRDGEEWAVMADATASLHNLPPQWLIYPSVDLATQRRTLRPKWWVYPLEHPLIANKHAQATRPSGQSVHEKSPR